MMDGDSELNDAGKPHRRGCIKQYRSLRAVLAADLYRYEGRTGANRS
ncbi:hypothetical protein [Sphingomonas lenta]|nr:hypothetical protein [Sphingomonas lenta]